MTIPEHFKNHGYETLSAGKVFPQGNLNCIQWKLYLFLTLDLVYIYRSLVCLHLKSLCLYEIIMFLNANKNPYI